VVLAAESFKGCLTEALAAPMAEQDEAVIGLEARWVVREFKRRNRPCVYAGASQQVLTDERAVVAGPSADEKNT
jgi:hypothetical protein